jgi:threonine 3-dehydrogenase
MYHGGHVALLGILPNDTRIDWDQVIFKSLTVKGIYGREMFETWYKMTQMVLGGLDLRPVLTHHIPINEFETGFELMASGQCGKVVCSWR